MKRRTGAKFAISARLRSWADAVRGVWILLVEEPNARLHLIAAGLVVAAGWWLNVTSRDWCWLVGAIAMVWVAEAFNTAVEFLGDAVTEEIHPAIRNAKDIAAGAVLVAVAAALVIGCLVLGPYLLARPG